MGSGGEDYGANNYAAGQNLYNTGGYLAGDNGHPEYAYLEAGYNAAKSAKEQETAMMRMMESMMGGSESSSSSSSSSQADLYASQQAESDRRADEARIAGLTNTRDGYITNYFDAANAATSYVSEKISGEKANAALMGVDYNMTDEIKGDRIANYFGTLWSEGSQQQLEGSFGEIGSGGFEQTVWRGEGVEAGPGGGLGEQKSGGGITPRSKANTLVDDENQLGAPSILGA